MIAARAKKMLMGDLDVGQYLFESTDTMLPKKHSACMETLLKMFGHGVIVVDVACGSTRAALALLVPTTTLSRYVPADAYVVQTATFRGDTAVVELVAKSEIEESTWRLSRRRVHDANEFPKRHIPRIAQLAQSEAAADAVKRDMSIVFIWERDELDDFASLCEYVYNLLPQGKEC